MTDAIFNVDNLQEGGDIEAKRAAGRDGKGAVPNDMWESYSAFANTDGGIILLGAVENNNRFEATGIEDTDRVLTALWTQLNNPQKASTNLLQPDSILTHPVANGRHIISIEVPRASRKQRPVFIKGNPMVGTYKRLHSGDFRCTPEEVKRMLAEQTEDARDARILAGYGFDDISADSFKAYRNRFAALKPDHAYNADENLDFLRKLGGWRKDRVTGEEGLTLAGLLMFGKGEVIHEAVQHYFVDYRELPASRTKTDWSDRLVPDGTWSGNLYDFYRLVIQRLFRNLKVPFRLQADEREDDTPIHRALRETLVNTMIHADYSASISILVVQASDYFGFRNPGRMRIPIEKALEGGHSDCRNRSLQRMFSMIGLGEQAGSGLPRVVENWSTRHYRFPELWESQEPEATLMRLRTVSLLPENTIEELRNQFGSAFDTLNENERLALATAQIENSVSNSRMQQICRLHPHDITALLKKLVESNFLAMTGKGRATTYQITGTNPSDPNDIVQMSNRLSLNPDTLFPPPINTGISPLHTGISPLHTADIEGKEESPDDELIHLAEPVRSNQRVAPDTTKRVILELCTDRFLSIQKMAQLLDRSAEGLRSRFIKPLFDAGQLERRFPEQPSHEQQAYRTVKKRT